MSETQESTAIVQQNNFDEILLSLSVIAKQAKHHEPIGEIEPEKTWYGKTKKNPTITDVNNVISKVDSHLIDLKDFNSKIITELSKVYMVMSGLDRSYISSLCDTADMAKGANDTAEKNVQSISDIVAVLKALEHLRDVDAMWENIAVHNEKISGFGEELKKIKDEQQDFTKKMNDSFGAHQGEISQKLEKSIGNIKDEQAARLNEIEQAQETAIEENRREQNEQLDAMKKVLEEEKNFLAATVAALAQKVKIAYLVAGGAAILAAINFLLSIFGVL